MLVAQDTCKNLLALSTAPMSNSQQLLEEGKIAEAHYRWQCVAALPPVSQISQIILPLGSRK